MAKHKTLGQVFTPHWIIAEILDLVGVELEKDQYAESIQNLNSLTIEFTKHCQYAYI